MEVVIKQIDVDEMVEGVVKDKFKSVLAFHCLYSTQEIVLFACLHKFIPKKIQLKGTKSQFLCNPCSKTKKQAKL